jgi:hypothetical protein
VWLTVLEGVFALGGKKSDTSGKGRLRLKEKVRRLGIRSVVGKGFFVERRGE